MTDSPHNQDTKILEDSADKSFENLLDDKQPGFLREFWHFFCNNKKWWLWPILISLLVVLVLVLIGNSPLAPFFYPFI
ncbi:MAG: DUF5989 family protein [Verrucomicrobiota bacterium]|nr:DUF5989 family protein [Verrucomicrobiota bacterium]